MRSFAAALLLFSNLLAASPRPPVQDTQTPEEIAFAKELPRIDRLTAIAEQIHDPKANTVELMTEAARLCGFSIWKDNREKVADPLAQPKLGLAITDTEIKWFAKMQQSGEAVTFGSLIDALDVLYKGLGADGSCGPKISKAYRTSFRNKNASIRALTTFLQATNRTNPMTNKGEEFGTNSYLSPVEALFLLRVVTEEMTTPLRDWLKKKGSTILYASTDPTQMGVLPGWAEDFTQAVFTEGFSQLVELIESTTVNATQLQAIEIFKNVTNKVNAMLTMTKLISTYATLECKFSVDAPGQPLIRTTSRNPGETRVVNAHWYVDAPQVLDWLKDHRFLFAPGMIDPDAPHSGDLANVETDWQLVRNTNTGANQVVQVHVDISKVKTDAKGVARVEFEGKPQQKDMNRNQVAPVEKMVQIQVTPQTKATSVSQDMVDAVTGAIGIIRGGMGWATPVMESLYRLKWIGTKGYKLQVRDWVPGETRGTITITIHGYGSTVTPYGRSWESIDRIIQYHNVVMEDLGVPPPEPLNLDPSTPPNVRQQAQQFYNQMLDASKSRPFVSEGPGTCFLSIDDASGGEGLAGGCGPPADTAGSNATKGKKTETFAASDILAGDPTKIGFVVTLDLKTMIAVIQASGELEATQTSNSNSSGTMITSTRTVHPRLMDVIDEAAGGLKITVTEAKDLGSKQVVFRGNKNIPFYFGPNDRYRGTCAVSFELIRVPKKNP